MISCADPEGVIGAQPMCVHRRIRVLRAPKLTLRSLDLEAI